MAATMQFDLVSPERRLMSVEASEVQLPGTDGDMTVMPEHTALITTLRPGFVKVSANGETSEYVVTGGFADIGPNGISLLAERAVPRSECTREVVEQMIEDAKSALAQAEETFVNESGPVDDAAKLLSDMVAIGDEIGV